MKLLFIFTGGTIGSTLSGDVMYADTEKSYKLLHAYDVHHQIDFAYDTVSPYLALSENNTGEQLRLLTSCVRENLTKGYDGIIITHGTDTLQYTAAAVGYAVGGDSIPVCIVSSNHPIEDARANGLANLHGAICFVREGAGRGAFVVYRNGDGVVRVHRATRLLSAIAYTDEVRSMGDMVYGQLDGDHFVKSTAYTEMPDAISTIPSDCMLPESAGIRILQAHPGMHYPDSLAGVRYLLLNSYHSGTVDTASAAALAFYRRAKEAGVPIYVTGVYGGPVYESASLFGSLGLVPLFDLSPIAAYIKLWMLSAAGRDVVAELALPLAGDRPH